MYNSVAVSGKKGKVMERRILKDFQIGIVEGIIKDVIARENKPKDVFSQIAKAIVRRGSTDSKKRDWNALVRSNTVRRDPIGTTAEAEIRRSRQSLRAHILENVHTRTIDPQKLLLYNPKLSNVTPTTRVAYAKFMRSKIRSDFAERERTRRDSDDISIDDEVFESPKRPTLKISGRTFRSRTPIIETSDDEILKDNEVKIEADIEDKGSESNSARTRPLKSSSQEPSQPSTPGFDSTNDKEIASAKGLQHHVIQIEPETPTKNLYITKDEDIHLQKPITPTTHPEQILSASALETQYKQIVESEPYARDSKKTKMTGTATVDHDRMVATYEHSRSHGRLYSIDKDTKLISASLETQMAPSRLSISSESKSPEKTRLSSSSSPKSPHSRTSRISPSSPTPSMVSGDKGRSKVTGKFVSGWL